MAKAKKIEGLDCHQPARDAIALVLQRRLEEMCELRARALDFHDPEGVHDMRVSSRRLRSALRDFSTYLKKSKLAEPVKQVKELATELGAVRDADVAIIALERIHKEAPPERAVAIQKLIEVRELKRQQERRSLVRTLTQKNLNHLRRDFIDTVPAALAKTKSDKESTEVTYSQLAEAIVKERVSELQSLADGLYDPHRRKKQHRMRIAAKRLRYAVELFAPCFGDRTLPFARQIAQMQSSLGGIHDCDVWIDYFGNWVAEDHVAVKDHTESQRDAMVWLLGHFTKLRAKHYRAALSQWRDWERKGFLSKLTGSHAEAGLPVKPSEQIAETPAGLIETSVTPVKDTVERSESRQSRGGDDTEPEKRQVAPVKRDVTLDELNSSETKSPNEIERAEDLNETHRVVKLEPVEPSEASVATGKQIG